MSILSSTVQTPQQVNRISNFFQVGLGQALDCSTSSASVILTTLPAGSVATDVMLFNNGTVNVFFAFGATAPTAVAPADGTPANGMILAPGAYLVINKGSTNTYIAAITASSTATIYFYQGYGS